MSPNSPYPSQVRAPRGYNPRVYGPWPARGVTIVKMFLPPTWGSSRTFQKFSTPTTAWNNDYNPSFNPLLMDPELSQLIDSWCSCRYLCATVLKASNILNPNVPALQEWNPHGLLLLPPDRLGHAALRHPVPRHGQDARGAARGHSQVTFPTLWRRGQS